MRRYSLARDDSTPSVPEAAATILNGLNDMQRRAAAATEGPVMIIAGPGSGKTRTLTHRIAYLLAAGRARPEHLLALTFTNKAAREMRERVTHLVGPEGARGIWMGTFHATFARLLRVECEALGYTRDFSIYDTDDTQRILQELMRQYNIDPRQFNPRSMRALISSAKNQMVGPSEYARMSATLAQEKAARLYGPYQEVLRRSNALDFDDLLLKPIDLFEAHPEILEKYQRRWSYIHIDEYQDTNHAQYVIAKQLADKHRNLCVVGDDAQSIYAFRGADIGNILSFQRDYPDANVIRLEQSYRSTKRILRLADSIIGHNKNQLEKSLWTENREGEAILLLEALSEKDEAQKIERRIRDLHARTELTFRDFAVLYRTNAQSRSLEDAFRRGGIPYRVVGGVSFYQRKEIKDVLAYLRLVVNPSDAASLRRVLNYPTRGIGAKTEERIVAFAREQRLTLWQAIERIEETDLPSRSQSAVEAFRFLIARHAARVQSHPADEVARDLIKEAGILEELRGDGSAENLVRWENVQELLNAIAEYAELEGGKGMLSGFLQEVSLFTDADKDDADEDRMTLMTLHASKGLEFPVVFVAGLEEGLFPLAAAAQDRKELEEERRLFYVGVTRAKEYLVLSYARSRFRYGEHQPSVRSRFLEEVDADLIRTEVGGTIRQREDRFSLRTGSSANYDQMDPHYYRESLSSREPSRTRRLTPSPGSHDQATEQRRAASTERRIVYDEGEGGGIVPGTRVEHERFGEGKVLAIEGNGPQTKAVVFFKGVGQKKLVLRFAKLRRIE